MSVPPLNKQQGMVLSLPSSGSDWFTELLVKHVPWAVYYKKEFFNPACNWPLMDRLAKDFGCELPCTRYNLIPEYVDEDALARCYADTWLSHDARAAGWNFNKEVWSYHLVPFWAARFQCMVLARTSEWTFPPTRARVVAWYDAIWHGMNCGGCGPAPVMDRVRDGHDKALAKMLSDAAVCGVPVLWYESLFAFNERELGEHLHGLLGGTYPGLDAHALARDIVATRKMPERLAENAGLASKRKDVSV